MGVPERQPVSPFPFAVVEAPPVEVPGVEELAPGALWLPLPEFGVAEFGVALSGEF